MAEHKFKIGDIVQLKSGGPSMTVRGYEPVDSDEVVCEWFDKTTFCSKAFHQGTLTTYQSPVIIAGPTVRSIKNNY